jgi:hypothetical protein
MIFMHKETGELVVVGFDMITERLKLPSDRVVHFPGRLVALTDGDSKLAPILTADSFFMDFELIGLLY